MVPFVQAGVPDGEEVGVVLLAVEVELGLGWITRSAASTGPPSPRADDGNDFPMEYFSQHWPPLRSG